MGVPKFFRWLSERYPLINQTVDLINVGPIIDNLYLDMNGIIHNCTHSDDSSDSKFNELTEIDMFGRVMQYIDHIFSVVQPRKLLFLAIDGVAPRAKMNQQRQRRYRSAETMAEAAQLEPQAPGAKAPFDSNCITPGTPFMARLSEAIKFYIQKKIKEDQSWRDVEIIFSGHEVPGEGEHKILEYIRYQKSIPNYNPNLSHCMYGLDADLIMLSLVSHEPHFSLIREDDVLKGLRTKSAVASFHFLHISLVREYIGMDFESLKTALPASVPWNLERIIDDFVLLCFLVGNDFLPSLPMLNIAEGSLNRILETYKKAMPQLGGYMTERGEVDLSRLEGFFRVFCEGEENSFDILPFGHENLGKPHKEAKGGMTRSRNNQHKGHTTNAFHSLADSALNDRNLATVLYAQRQADSDSDSGSEADHTHLQVPHPRVAALTSDSRTSTPASSGMSGTSSDLESSTSEDTPGLNPLDHPSLLHQSLEGLSIKSSGSLEHPGAGLFGPEDEVVYNDADVELWKVTYYREKLHMDLTDTAAHDKLRTHYLEGLMWVYHYYFHGCISWSWFFPYHYAPLISDLVDISKYAPNIKFQRSQPFKPYQQLLGVLPPKSAALLPPAYQHLLLSNTSPLFPFLPDHLEIDREGTRNEWEGVVILPFIDEKIIVEVSESVPLSELTPAEIKANTFGNAFTYKYDPTISETVPSPLKELFDDLTHCGSEALVYRHPETTDQSMYSHMADQPPLLNSFFLLAATHLGANKPPTLPTLFSKRLVSHLQKNNTRVLQRGTRFESLVMRITDFDEEGETTQPINGRMIRFLRRDKRVDPVQLDIESLACEYHGNSCYVWPYNREAKVIAIMDENGYYDANGNAIAAKAAEAKDFPSKAKTLDTFAEEQQAVDIGDVRIIFEVLFLNGVSRALDGSLVKQWAEKSTLVAFQCVLEKVPFGPDPRFIERPSPPLTEQYPVNSSVVYLPQQPGPLYGALAEVVGYKEDAGQVILNVDQIERINSLMGNNVLSPHFAKWHGARDVAKMTGLSPSLLGRVTSSILFDDRTDLGLHLRFSGRGQQTLTYTRRVEVVDRNTGQMNSWWEYSQKSVDLIIEYVKTFHDIFEKLGKATGETISAHDIFKDSERLEKANAKQPSGDTPHEGAAAAILQSIRAESDSDSDSEEEKKKPRGRGPVRGPNYVRQKQMLEWAAAHRPSKSLRVPCGTIGFDRDAILKMEKELDRWHAQHPPAVNPKTRTFTVTRQQVYSPLPPLEVLHKNNVDATGRAEFKLGERAVFILNSGAVPFGTAGTIVTVSKTHVELLLDSPYVGGTDLGGRCTPRRGISVPHGAVVNTTAPFRKNDLLRSSSGSSSPAWTGKNSSDRIRSSGDIRASHDRAVTPNEPLQGHWAKPRDHSSEDKPHRQGEKKHHDDRRGDRPHRQGDHEKHQPRNNQQSRPPRGDNRPATTPPEAAPSNAPAKRVAARPKQAGAAKEPAHKEHKPKQEYKPKSSGETAPSPAATSTGKQVDVQALFSPAASTSAPPQAASAPPQESLSIPGLTLDAAQMSFFNSLSGGHGSKYAQQNMPYAPQPMVMMPPNLLPASHVGHYMAAAPYTPQGGASVPINALFNGAAVQPAVAQGRSVSVDVLLPGPAQTSDPKKAQ